MENEAIYQELSEIVQSMGRGDYSGFGRLYDETRQMVYYQIKNASEVPDEYIDDVMQEVYLKIYNTIGSISNPRAAWKWIKVTAYRVGVDYHRKRNRLREFTIRKRREETNEFGDVFEEGDPFLSEPLPMPENVMENAEAKNLMATIISGLSEAETDVIVSFYYNEMSVSEISQMYNIPANTVKTRLRRAKGRIRDEVLAMEKNYGIRLHSFMPAPVFLAVLAYKVQTTTVPAAVDAAVKTKLAAVFYSAGNIAACSALSTGGQLAGAGAIEGHGQLAGVGTIEGHGQLAGARAIQGHGQLAGVGAIQGHGQLVGAGAIQGHGQLAGAGAIGSQGKLAGQAAGAGILTQGAGAAGTGGMSLGVKITAGILAGTIGIGSATAVTYNAVSTYTESRAVRDNSTGGSSSGGGGSFSVQEKNDREDEKKNEKKDEKEENSYDYSEILDAYSEYLRSPDMIEAVREANLDEGEGPNHPEDYFFDLIRIGDNDFPVLLVGDHDMTGVLEDVNVQMFVYDNGHVEYTGDLHNYNKDGIIRINTVIEGDYYVWYKLDPEENTLLWLAIECDSTREYEINERREPGVNQGTPGAKETDRSGFEKFMESYQISDLLLPEMKPNTENNRTLLSTQDQ